MSAKGQQSNVIPLRPVHSDAAGIFSVDPTLRLAQLLDLDSITGQYGENIWDLAGHPAWKVKAGDQTKIDFTRVDPYWRPLVKLWALCSLAPGFVAAELRLDTNDIVALLGEPLRPVTVQGNVKAAGLALDRLATSQLYTIGRDDWDRATAALRGSIKPDGVPTATRTCMQWANQIVALHRFGSLVGWPSPFGSDPWSNQSVADEFTPSGTERHRLNAVRPTEAVGEVLGVAAFVIDQLADDIIAHTAWWHDAMRDTRPPATAEHAREALSHVYIEHAQRHGNRIPGVARGNTVVPAHEAMCALIGGVQHLAPDTTNATRGRKRTADKATPLSKYGLKRAENSMGISLVPDLLVSPCPLPIKTFPAAADRDVNVPWAPRLLWSQDELRFWVSALLYSVAYYTQATIGLRDLDRDLLAIGCVQERRVDTGGGAVTHWELHGWKQKQLATPQQATWPVGERIARAIGYIEQLHSVLDTDPAEITELPVAGQRRLFSADINVGSDRPGRNGIYLDQGYMRWFRNIGRRLHDAGLVDHDLSDVPNVNSREIRITAMQAYADRTMGQALSAAYGKWTTSHVMRGYVGDVTQRIVFVGDDEQKQLRDIENEMRAQHLINLAQQGDTLSGNGQSKLGNSLDHHEDLTAQLAMANAQPLNKKQLRRLGQTERHLEVGPYTHCFFDPAHALCGGRGSADFRLCRPGACHNSVLTRAQRAAVELRRRVDASLHGALMRDLSKVNDDFDDADFAEFAAMTDAELRDVIDAETAAFLTQAVGAPKPRRKP